jgi:hypothetical protein
MLDGARWGPYESMRAMARVAGARFMETRGWFCYRRMCPTVIGQSIAFMDESHVSQTYALRLVNVFRSAFRHAIAPR